MNFPVVPLLHFLRADPKIADAHVFAATLGALLCCFLGIIHLAMYVPEVLDPENRLPQWLETCRGGVSFGLFFLGLALVFLMVGIYLMWLAMLLLATISVYLIIQGIGIAFTKR